MSDDTTIFLLRAAGVMHFVTLLLAIRTPIPPEWEANLAKLPPLHRRFALAQNFYIGATIAALGLLSLGCAAELASGTALARAVCAGIALFWGGRAALLPWLAVRPTLTTTWLKGGFALLVTECVAYFLGYGWLAVRPL